MHTIMRFLLPPCCVPLFFVLCSIKEVEKKYVGLVACSSFFVFKGFQPQTHLRTTLHSRSVFVLKSGSIYVYLLLLLFHFMVKTHGLQSFRLALLIRLISCIHRHQSGVKIPGEGRKSGGALAPPAPPSLAPMIILKHFTGIFCRAQKTMKLRID